jgi:hypothetical protein
MTVFYTLIGDLVGSRRLADRAGAQGRLAEALEHTNAALAPAQRLEPTVGDEFQGGFATLVDAVLAALLVRLAVRSVVDVRCGIGHGDVTVHDATRRPLLQDGPGWWAARDALDQLGEHQRWRTWVVADGADAINAFLLCRDQLVDRLNDRGADMLALALLGRSQKQIAESLGVTASAVSQQFARGVGAVVDSHRLIKGASA